MGDGHATAVLTVHRAGTAEEFAAFADLVGADAAAAPGFVGWARSVLTSELLEWAIAVSFADERRAHDWLDRSPALFAGNGYLRAGLELFVDGAPRTPGVMRVRDITDVSAAEFVATAERLARLEREQPGFEGSSVFPPGGDDPHAWSTVIRFRTEEQLAAWVASPERSGALPDRPAHPAESSEVLRATSFGSTVAITDGHAAVTPEWKTALTIQLVLYPLVMLLGRFLNPWIVTFAPQPWLATFISLSITIVILSWVVMPLAVRALRRWLDPVEGARRTVSLAGTAVVGAGYALSLLVFGTVPFLQH